MNQFNNKEQYRRKVHNNTMFNNNGIIDLNNSNI